MQKNPKGYWSSFAAILSGSPIFQLRLNGYCLNKTKLAVQWLSDTKITFCKKRKTFLYAMKLYLFFFLVCITQLEAKSFSQTITLDAKNMSFKSVIANIKAQIGYGISYSDDLSLGKPVTISVKNISLSEFLDRIVADQPFSYKIFEKNILFTKKTEHQTPLNKKSSEKSAFSRIKIVVVDTAGDFLSGATISIKSKPGIAITNSNGEVDFDLDEGDLVVVSYIGHITQTVQVTAAAIREKRLIITLKADIDGAGTMDDLVVIGYGSVRKSDLTGSVSSVKVDELADVRPATSVEQLLQGQAAGVQITANTGAPGGGMTFSVRGATSISGSNQPLIVIDGYPIGMDDDETMATEGNSYDNRRPLQNPLANLNPGDIESIEILKDASATAIYGSRAANGVVLVTTKRGKGKDRITYNFRSDISMLPRKIDVLNTMDYINYSNEAAINSGRDSIFADSLIAKYRNVNTNWQDLIYQTAISQNHQLTLSGGESKWKYALSLGFLQQEGVIKKTKFNRGDIRLNLDRKFNDRLAFGASMSAVMNKNQGTAQASGDPISGSTVRNALTSRPLDAPFTADDELDLTQANNPLVFINLFEDINRNVNVMTNMFIDYTIAKGLLFKIRGGASYSSTRRDFYAPRGTILGNNSSGYAYYGEGNSFNYLNEYTLNYDRTFNNKHRLNAVGGYTYHDWTRRKFGVRANNFPNDKLKYYDLSSAAAVGTLVSYTEQWALSSFIGRANYSYDNKYLFTFTGRADGSTRLAEGSKWDFFPSFALGWNLHNENFMKAAHWINELKLRASYGFSGNQAIGIGATRSRLNSTTNVIDETVQISYTLANLANSTLKWERTKQTNIGLDLSVLNRTVNFTFDYYNKITNDLLMNLNIPGSTGFGSYPVNQGKIENNGYEFSVATKPLNKEVKWNLAGNISFNRNKILSLGDGVKSFSGPIIGPIANNSSHIAKVGFPIGSFYGYRIIGIYQNDEEVQNGPVDSDNAQPGTFKYKDINGDGRITADDREVIGNPFPNYGFGINSDLTWRNISLSASVIGTIGQDIINLARHNLDALARENASNIRQEAYDNRWVGEGTSNTYPKARMSNAFSGRFTDFIVEDGSYVRLKFVTISYRFVLPKKYLINEAKVYATTTNLLTWTKYKGYDPEINSLGGNAMMAGVDNANIPQFRTFSIGLSLGL